MIGHRRGISAAFCGGVLVLWAAPAPAQQGVFMRDALSGIGLIEPEKPVITYRERAPLAMPPKLGAPLPPPQARAQDPRWPKDPEIAQRERAAAEANKPIVRGAQGRVNDNNETLSVYELDAGRKAGAGIPDGPVVRPGDGNREATWLNPIEMLRGAGSRAEPSAVEPERGSLAEPPTGYRRAPVKVAAPPGAPVGGSISGNEEADPRAFYRTGGR